MSSPDAGSPSAIAPLLTPAGWELLNRVGPYVEAQALTLNESLRREGHPPELVAAVLSQARLRARAADKFGEFARSMLFTPDGLEQATRLSVAALHAQRFVTAGLRRVADLGCGIGADAMALAALDREVTAVERDETTAAVATLNLMPWPNARVVQADATAVDLTDVDGVWLDPARRTGHTTRTGGGARRLFDPESFSPPFSFVETLAAGGTPVGVKLGPGLAHEAVPTGAEAQWVSVDGGVAEVGLWFGPLHRPDVARAAVVLPAHGAPAELTSPEPFDPGTWDGEVGPVGRYVIEPDGAVIRAGLVTDLARHLQAHQLNDQIAYLSADTHVATPFARAYTVREVLPFHLKTMRAWVREHRVGTLEIKKRGIAQTPEQIRRDLAPKGSGRATLIITRLGAAEKRVAIVADPIPR
ncbi:class I SAM-dependent methyltransferase [Tersicoccus sp. Bi-70]|uniref:class I SAM-dependent methyltransferase n=1 Tax=Tersicoccus sp. Bi-70 TaxID=1897634 RepID=UPI0009757BB4|nr:class I SAM-dependent methyltransferase [Tersicoccus sp. Bi-70]OMH34991.1 SAM-dependent methyltransferase [Tersicoccus sp. Bi-70]